MYILSAHQNLRIPSIQNSSGTSGLLSGFSSRSKAFRGKQPHGIGVINHDIFRTFRLPAPISAKIQAVPGPINNMNEEDLEKLLDEYGEVIYTNPHRSSPSAEANDDAESLSLAVALAKAANDVKAVDIQVLCVKPLVYWTRFFIIATAFSRPQIDAIGSKIRDIAEQQFKIAPRGDTKPNSWTLLDFGDVVVHIFLPPQRAYYNLEEFYGNATLVELPFETQTTRQG